MFDVRRSVEIMTDSMTIEVRHDGETEILGFGFDRGADLIEGNAGCANGNASVATFLGAFDETPTCVIDAVSDEKRPTMIAVITVEIRGDVDADNIAIAERTRVGNSVTNDVINADAATAWIIPVFERRRIGAASDDGFVNE